MLIKEAIKILIKEDLGIAALVGTHLFPLQLPQTEDYPALAWGRIDRKMEESLNGDEPAESRLVADWFEFWSFAKGPGGDAISEDIDDAVVEALQGFRGIVYSDSSPSDTMTIQGIFHQSLKEFHRDELQLYMTRSIYRVESVRKRRPLA